MAVSHNGIHILNGRHLRSKRQYRNKLLEKLTRKIDRKKKGSRRTKRLASTNKRCHFVWYRNSAGACNIRKKYLGDTPVVGALAPTMGMRSYPHVRVAQREKAYRCEAAGFVARVMCHWLFPCHETNSQFAGRLFPTPS